MVDRAVAAIDRWLDRFDVMIVGPGLGRDELVHETVVQARSCLQHQVMGMPAQACPAVVLDTLWLPRQAVTEFAVASGMPFLASLAHRQGGGHLQGGTHCRPFLVVGCASEAHCVAHMRVV